MATMRLLASDPLTQEEAEAFHSVGAGTLMGELLRRYWWPIGISADLKDKPTLVRLLGEDLVLFRDGDGKVGAIAARCAHRGVNLCFGTTESYGLRCRYHGWLYDIHGNVLDTPGESDDDFKDTFKQPAYKAEELGGAIWLYMGPDPTPLLPRLIFLVQGTPKCQLGQFENHNWLNGVENGCDPIHTTFLHGSVWQYVSAIPDDVRFEAMGDQFGNPWGIFYKAHRAAGSVTGTRGTVSTGDQVEDWRINGITMPGISRTMSIPDGYDYPITVGGRWSVPIDDTHTLHFTFANPAFRDTRENRQGQQAEMVNGGPRGTASSASPAVVPEPFKEYKNVEPGEKVVLGYDIPPGPGPEDATMRQSLGLVGERMPNEHLMPNADVGVTQLRRLYLEQAYLVREGRDPMGVVRDPAENEYIEIRGDTTWPLD